MEVYRTRGMRIACIKNTNTNYRSTIPTITWANLPRICTYSGQYTRRELEDCESIQQGHKNWLWKGIGNEVDKGLQVRKDIRKQWCTDKPRQKQSEEE